VSEDAVHAKNRLESLFSGAARGELESMLAPYVEKRRWFRSKSHATTSSSVALVVPLPIASVSAVMAIVRVRYRDAPDEEYVVPLALVDGTARAAMTHREVVVGAIAVDGEREPWWLVDALGEPRALSGLLALVAREARIDVGGAALVFRRVGEGHVTEGAAPHPIETEQSNTSVVYGHACILKIVRKLETGRAADLEMGEYLTAHGYAHAPAVYAAIELTRDDREPATVGVVSAFVPNQGDAWTHALARVAQAAADAPLRDTTAFARPLARRIAEMHAVLAAPTHDPRFVPEPIERAEREGLGATVVASLETAWRLFDARSSALPPDASERLRAVRDKQRELHAIVDGFAGATASFMKTRVHGDLHLGQVLVSGDEFVLIDFEGEPARSLAARKSKRSPLVDVAGMLRSLHYASVAGWRTSAAPAATRAAAARWHLHARREFTSAYFDAAPAPPVLPLESAARASLLRFYLLEKCVYELHYELNNRPDWVAIPVFGLESLLE
jgi:trehalose synthase-fused probable maltokinase